jgi:hypothetical protein
MCCRVIFMPDLRGSHLSPHAVRLSNHKFTPILPSALPYIVLLPSGPTLWLLPFPIPLRRKEKIERRLQAKQIDLELVKLNHRWFLTASRHRILSAAAGIEKSGRRVPPQPVASNFITHLLRQTIARTRPPHLGVQLVHLPKLRMWLLPSCLLRRDHRSMSSVSVVSVNPCLPRIPSDVRASVQFLIRRLWHLPRVHLPQIQAD